MMQYIKRHVLIFDKPPSVKSVLQELSEGIQTDGNVRREIRRGLEEFAKHGGVRLILDLQVIERELEGSPATIRNFSAFVAGDVLIITGHVTSHWMLRILQIEAESRRHFFRERLMSKVGAIVSNTVVPLETAIQRIAGPIRRTTESLVRVRAR
jgi:hypothetical protein